MAFALETERLILRAWRESDREPFAALTADPEVMRFFPSVLTREESDALADKIEEHMRAHGFTFWAVEERTSGAFVGFVGLARTPFEAHFTPCVEIGWRLAKSAWGKGYASEAARESLRFGFEELGLDEIVSFTAESNVPSRKVMERIGMRRDPRAFDHPRVAPGHPLCRHVLYRLPREVWKRRPT
jgi:RimJ/RimL family protein N-acetyltransferase